MKFLSIIYSNDYSEAEVDLRGRRKEKASFEDAHYLEVTAVQLFTIQSQMVDSSEKVFLLTSWNEERTKV